MKPIYKVTVEVVREEEVLTSREYVQLGPKKEGEDNWGHTEQVMHIEKVSRILYEQTVEELDIPALIAQVNIPPPVNIVTIPGTPQYKRTPGDEYP